MWCLYSTGQASSSMAESIGKQAEFMASLAWDFATREGFRVFKGLSATKEPSPRLFSTWVAQRPFPSRSYSTGWNPASKSHLIVSPDGLPSRVQELYHKLRRFMDVHIYPTEQLLRDYQASQSRWTPHPLIEELKASHMHI